MKTLLRVETADLEAIMKHYDITNETLNNMVMSVREWYEKQAHLPEGQIRKYFLL